jgi:hypothetical protein
MTKCKADGTFDCACQNTDAGRRALSGADAGE